MWVGRPSLIFPRKSNPFTLCDNHQSNMHHISTLVITVTFYYILVYHHIYLKKKKKKTNHLWILNHNFQRKSAYKCISSHTVWQSSIYSVSLFKLSWQTQDVFLWLQHFIKRIYLKSYLPKLSLPEFKSKSQQVEYCLAARDHTGYV